MKLSKKRTVAFVAGVLALTLIVGAWAYFTASSSINNEMQTKEYGVKTVEEFTPKQDLEPGKEIAKTVGVTNTGDYDLVVRVKLDEKWERGGSVIKTIAYNGNINTVAYSAGPPEAWTATQAVDDDGLIVGDTHTVVYKKLNLGANWVKGSDGYFYYTAKLSGGQSTGNLLEAIRLASNADMGKYETTLYYSIADKATINDLIAAVAAGTATEATLEAAYAWTTTKPADKDITYIKSENALKAGYEGYANAAYTLTITTEVCQATAEAVNATWTMTAADLALIKTAWLLP